MQVFCIHDKSVVADIVKNLILKHIDINSYTIIPITCLFAIVNGNFQNKKVKTKNHKPCPDCDTYPSLFLVKRTFRLITGEGERRHTSFNNYLLQRLKFVILSLTVHEKRQKILKIWRPTQE